MSINFTKIIAQLHLGKRAQQALYYVTTNPKLLATAAAAGSAKPLPEKIAALERKYIESQGVALEPNGDLIVETGAFLKKLRNGHKTEFDSALAAALQDITALAQFTPEEIHTLYIAFSHFIKLNETGQPITKITKQARVQIIARLDRLKAEIRASASFQENEQLLDQISCLIEELCAASIRRDSGEVNMHFDLSELFSSCLILGHEAGHPFYKKHDMTWPDMVPLTFYSKTKQPAKQQREEDFCENYTFYLNGQLVFRLLAAVSQEWADKYAILQEAGLPKTGLVNPAVFGYLCQHLAVRMEEHWPIFAGLSKAAMKGQAYSFFLSLVVTEPAVEINPVQHAFNSRSKTAFDQGSINLEAHRRIISALMERGLYEALGTIRYRGRALEEYGVSPDQIKLLELLREIPETIEQALDENQGKYLFIGFYKSESDPYSITMITPDRLGYDFFSFWRTADPNLLAILAKKPAELPPARSTQAIAESSQAAELSLAKRAVYYQPFEKNFGIKLAGSERREFSAREVAQLTDRLNSIPPTLRKMIKTIRRVSTGGQYASCFSDGVLAIDDLLSVFLGCRSQFFFKFCQLFTYPLFCHLEDRKNKAFARFLGSGGWAKWRPRFERFQFTAV
jgi:hypothetical protein